MEASASPSGSRRRRELMLRRIGERGFLRVADLSHEFGVSTVTVRADLDALEAGGAIRRIRGGAIPVGGGELRERSFDLKRVEAAAEKARIAQAAVAEVEPGMSIMLDVGTTTTALAAELARREDLHDVTVITSGLAVALALEAAIPRLQVVVTGGTLRPLQHSLVAPLADGVLPRVHADVAFIGCNGIDARAGVTNINLAEADVKRAMIAGASRCVVVADGAKIGQVHLSKVADLGQVDEIVTSRAAPRDALRELRAVAPHRVRLVG